MNALRVPPGRRLPYAALVWTAGVVLVAVLAVAPGWSIRLYEVSAVEPLIGWGALLSEVAVLALVVSYVAAGLWVVLGRTAPRASPWDRLSGLVAGGVAAILAYGLNLLLKESFAAVRPCHVHDVASACPPLDNWSFPSNHTVIAFALAVGLATTMPRLAWSALPLAVIAGSARVFAGDHYPHDVLAGAVVGTTVSLGVVALAAPVLTPMIRRCRAGLHRSRHRSRHTES